MQDNGIGIAEKDQHLIFDKFVRLEHKDINEIGGYGLGLSIVKNIVAAHHGNILLDSKLGKGSQFTIILPLITPPTKQDES